jgi:hypothetical protein
MAVVFLVCVETAGNEARPGLRQRLKAWRAEPCLDRCWMIATNTTSRIVYDTLAQEIDDKDRLFVCEVPADAVWYNLRCENYPRRPPLLIGRSESCNTDSIWFPHRLHTQKSSSSR